MAQISADVQGLALTAADPRLIAAKVIRIALGFLGVIVVALIIYGGLLWMTAAGNEERIEKAKKVLTSSVIGLAIVLSSLAITQFVLSKLQEATRGPGEVSISVSCPNGDCSGQLSADAFLVRGISPAGSIPIRNVVVRLVFNKAPTANLENLRQNIIVTRKDNGLAVELENPVVRGTTLELRPRSVCPEPNQTRKCFEADTEFKVEARSGLLSANGRALSCGGLAPACTREFRTGNLVDVAPPTVTVESPDQGGSVPVDSCVPVQAHVVDDAGVSSVEFFADGVLIEDGTVAPPGASSPRDAILEIPCWPTAPPAPAAHKLKAKAYDIDDNSATSLEVQVLVRPLHCFDQVKNDEEDQPDCDDQVNGPSGCGVCEGGTCTASSQCQSGACVEGRCATPTTITGISPGDGREGTFVTVAGLSFGTSPGAVTFSENRVAASPQACAGSTTWSDNYAVVGVPVGAVTGPLTIARANCAPADTLCRDSTNDARGPILPLHPRQNFAAQNLGGQAPDDGDFWVNNIAHPGLCSVLSPLPLRCSNNVTVECTSAAQCPAAVCEGGRCSTNRSQTCTAAAQCPAPTCSPASAGLWGTEVNLLGAQFGTTVGSVFFGAVSGAGLSNWSDTGARTAVPPIAYGTANVQVVNTEGTPSNALPYAVLAPDALTLPEIVSITPPSGGPISGLTITGRNFGTKPGLVWLVAPDGSATQADVSVPAQCGTTWWTPTTITVKVPQNLSVQTYKVYVQRCGSGAICDDQQSNRKDFTVTNAPPGPFLACIRPLAGPPFSAVSIYGERLGTTVTPSRGLYFTQANSPTFFAFDNNGGANPSWGSVRAELTNTGGVPNDSCPQPPTSPTMGWSATEVCAQVPGLSRTGNVLVEQEVTQGDGVVTRRSNPLAFTVGSCRLPATNPLHLDCPTDTICCGDGTCNSSCPSGVRASAYGWQFTTSPQRRVPRVLERCDSQEGEGHPIAELSPPSPTPGAQSGRGSDVNICINAQVAVSLSTPVVPATLNTPNNIRIEKCTGSDELVSGANASFAETTTLWGPPLTPLAAVRRQGQGRGVDPTDQGNWALQLTKLDDDTGPGWPDALGVQANYEHWFGYPADLDLDTNGRTYTATAYLKAADARTIGKRAGILLQREGGSGGTRCGGLAAASACATDADCATAASPALQTCRPTAGFWQKASQEITLSENWQPVSVTASFDTGPNRGATGFARIFLHGLPHDIRIPEPAPDPAELFSVLVDDVQVTGNPCMQVQPNLFASGRFDPYLDPNGSGDYTGFKWYPLANFEVNSWYRVTLMGGAGGITAAGEQGEPMIPAEDAAARCGNPNAGYCFRFKTRHEPVAANNLCAVGSIAVVPDPWQARQENETISYTALPLAAGDPCVSPRPDTYSWAWSSSNPAKATVSYNAVSNSLRIGHACAADADCAVGKSVCANDANRICLTTADCTEGEACNPLPACAQGYCQYMGWTTTATVLEETVPEHVRIRAHTQGIVGTGKLFVEFEPPQVISSWPNCGETCVNASIGAGFSKAMVSSATHAAGVTNPDNVQLWAVPCGNGVVDLGEDCDDGNGRDGDGCSVSCLHEGSGFALRCGDGIACTVDADCQSGEQCRSGRCLDLFEDCDDGNVISGDGCSNHCVNEGTAGPTCGNNAIDPGEDCDDGNVTSGDGCSAMCLHEGTRSDISICGNRRLDRGEECEANTEGVFVQWCDTLTCLRQGPEITAQCGNGRIDPGEECDQNMPLLDTAAKKALCNSASVAPPSYPCQWTGTQRPNRAGGQGCGNGKIEIGEDCDDSGTRPGDGCDEFCRNEGSVTVTTPACGNGSVDVGEDCDDGNVTSGDGCSDVCLNEGRAGAQCGNRLVDVGEDCDRGRLTDTHGAAVASAICSADCRNLGTDPVQPLAATDTAKPNTCGNGRHDDGEDCDGGAFCSASCRHESGRPAERVSASGVTLAWNGVRHELSLRPTALLLPHTFYRVLMRGDNPTTSGVVEGVRACRGPDCEAGKGLSNLNFSYSFAAGDVPPATSICTATTCNAFSWTFRTKEVACGVERVELAPQQASLYVIGARQPYSAEPFGPPDSCDPQGQRLNPFLYNWGWDTADHAVATIVDASLPAVSPYGVDVIPSCGNGRVERGEDCDDGNAFGGDGCTATCLHEGSVFPFACGETGGDRLDPGEECEPPGTVYCNTSCLRRGTEPCGDNPGGLCCGNGIVNVIGTPSSQVAIEDCDYGDNLPGDGCSPRCLHEGSSPVTTCGNGAIDSGEECDPADTATRFAGSTTPLLAHFCNPDTCLLRGTLPRALCGNGRVEPSEDCDFGNATTGDGDKCDALCKNEGTSAPTCGNGRIDQGEDCDDGNSLPGDGCSSTCRHEGTVREVGLQAKLDPLQQARAEGIKKFCRTSSGTLTNLPCTVAVPCADATHTCTPQNPWSVIAVTAQTQGQTGTAPLTVYCVAATDKDCPTPGGVSGHPTIGRGLGNCCYSRPQLVERTPGNGASNVCRNALLQAVFSEQLNPESLPGNFGLARSYPEAQGCPSGSRRLLSDGTIFDVNLLQNGSFESSEPADGALPNDQADADTTAVWTLERIPATSTATIERIQVAESDARGGTFVLKTQTVESAVSAIAENTSPGAAPSVRARARVALAANTAYTLSAWVKVTQMAAGVTVSPVAIGLFKDRGATAAPYFRFERGPLATTSGWVQLQRSFTTQEEGDYEVWVANLGGSTEAYFDVVELRRPLVTLESRAGSFLTRLWRRMLALISRFIPSAEAQGPVWCISNALTLSPTEQAFMTDSGASRSNVTLQPSRVLDENATYRILVIGDKSIADAAVSGVRALTGAGYFAGVGTGGIDQTSWQFSTGAEVCTLDEVIVEVTGETSFSTAGEQAPVHATAYHVPPSPAEPIAIGPTPGYSWIWSWGSGQGEIVSVSNSNADDQLVTSGSKNGTTTVNATARITEDFARSGSNVGECRAGQCANTGRVCSANNDCGEQEGTTRVGVAEFTTFICDNPWPATETGGPQPFIDVGAADPRHNPRISPPPPPERTMNFQTYYCRDGVTLLPPLTYPGAVLTHASVFPDSPAYAIASPDVPARLKEFLLTTRTFVPEREVQRIAGSAIEDSSSDGIVVASGNASAQSNAHFDYELNFSQDGTYELEVETTNFSDDLSNLARILDAKDISPATRGVFLEDPQEREKLSGAWYHEVEVYLDDEVEPRGVLVNRAVGPNATPAKGRVILGALAHGTHRVRLNWRNDQRLPEEPLAGRNPGDIWDANLRVYTLTLRQGKSQDQAVGIRIMSNPDRLSPLDWYRVMGFGGRPEPVAGGVDGYEAIRDGNTIYIAAMNATGPVAPSTTRTLYGNVYLVSLSEGASVDLKNIYDQLIKNLSFNVNLGNVKKCNDGAQQDCSKDLDCATDGTVECLAPKDKLRRDLVRLNHLTTLSSALAAYRTRTGRYPTLEAGTFIRGMSAARWPSWQATFGAALGTAPPQDPINLFASGCAVTSGTCSSGICSNTGRTCASAADCTESGTYDVTTCFNELAQTYRCPRGSHTYQYQSLGGVEATLSAEFELLERSPGPLWDMPNFPVAPTLAQPLTIDPGGVCSWTAGNPVSIWSNAQAACGNRVLEPGEICEPGSFDRRTVTFAAAPNRCSGDPGVTCSSAVPCPADKGTCLPLTSCTAVRSCNNACTDWNPWRNGTASAAMPVPADCSPGGTFCGNGIRDQYDLNGDGSPDEACDDGPLNGAYGKCTTTCSGLGAHCGDGTINGGEVCDKGSLNGGYGRCRFDCTGIGERCGDGQVHAPEEECESGDTQIRTRICFGAGAGETDIGKECTAAADCQSGLCMFCGPTGPSPTTQRTDDQGHPYVFSRPCDSSCLWWTIGGIPASSCVVQGGCGNGIKDGTEACDDGQNVADANNNDTPDGNEDGCTNSCELAECGDGYDEQMVCTSGPAEKRGDPCTVSQECGQGGVCQDPEECDQGAQNSVPCDPRYNGICSYCDAGCNLAVLSGGSCGDRVAQTPEEHCDGTTGFVDSLGRSTWMCKGMEALVSFTFSDFAGWVSDSNTHTALSRRPPGYHSASALRILRATPTDSHLWRYATKPDVLPNIPAGTYKVSAWVNEGDAAARGKTVRIQKTTAQPDTAGAQLVLDNDPATWQYLEATLSYSAGPAPVVVLVKGVNNAAQGGPGTAYAVLVDNLHLRPNPGPDNLDCTGDTCRRFCTLGVPCENKLSVCSGNSATDGDRCTSNADCGGSGGNCVSNNFDSGLTGALGTYIHQHVSSGTMINPATGVESTITAIIPHTHTYLPASTTVATNEAVGDIVANLCDIDMDNDGDPDSSDCDDNNAAINNDAFEVCGNGVDDNCNDPDDGSWSGIDECTPVTISVRDKDNDDDQFKVLVDGVEQGVVPQYSGGVVTEDTITIAELSPGLHVIKILFWDTVVRTLYGHPRHGKHSNIHDHRSLYTRFFSDNVEVLSTAFFASPEGITACNSIWSDVDLNCDAESTESAATISGWFNGRLKGEETRLAAGQGGYVEYLVNVAGGVGGGGGGGAAGGCGAGPACAAEEECCDSEFGCGGGIASGTCYVP